jgi:hypothetical protein
MKFQSFARANTGDRLTCLIELRVMDPKETLASDSFRVSLAVVK